ncbi:MAG TPA: hypothetical protein VL283_05550 [Candidatus Baltobacteraceae bacterium]|nr:hypothetical protein [Candidatus Baltobacteraceae bacterium]
MQERSTNRFAYATLIKTGFDPDDPEILLEIGMERPVDWDAVDESGAVICGKLSFVLTVGHAQVDIAFTYTRVVKDHGAHGGLHVYVLGLRPTPVAHIDKDGDIVVREPNREALETAVGESEHVRRRDWVSDIDRIRIFWVHQAPETAVEVENGAYEPEPSGEAPSATDDEVVKLCDAFDAFCADIDPAHDASVPFVDADLDLEPGSDLQLATA